MKAPVSSRVAKFLALDANIVAVSGAMFLQAFGENLWIKFLPKYLVALGAPIRAVGLFGSIDDFLDGIYQYPGGWLGDRLGRRAALLLFVFAAMAGYAMYAFAPRWEWIIAGLVLVSVWSSMGSPTLFAVVGDALPKGRRAMGFTVQSILKRLPIVVAPIIGGVVIARRGLVPGSRLLLFATLAISVMTAIVLTRVRVRRIEGPPIGVRGIWQSFPRSLRWLLVSDIFVRICEGLVDVFLVIYATSIAGVSMPQYGVLVAVQMITAIVVYLPAARIADRIGRKPFVIATFIAFSLFPLAVISARTFPALVAAFIVGGLREIGEPSRKALIVDFAEPAIRARTIGLYYFIRSSAIAPSAFAGGLLWERRTGLPFIAAAVAGFVGTLIFAGTVREEDAG